MPWLRSHGPVAAPIYAVLFWIVGVCLVPTNAYSLLGGYAFGFGVGLLAVMVGYAGAALLSYALMLRMSRQHVLAVVHEYPRLDAVRRALLEASPRRTVAIVALLRISPASPFAVSNFALASSGVSWREYLLGTVLGMLPKTTAVVYMASKLSSFDLHDPKEWWMVLPGFIATGVVLAILIVLARRELRKLASHPAVKTNQSSIKAPAK
ncbi:MAG: VTT domain-containing protein [Tepidisphaeraceae bacterium]